VGAEAHVRSGAEREDARRAARDVEAVRFRELALVAVRGCPQEAEARAGAQRLAVQAEVLRDGAAQHLRRHVVAERFLEGVRRLLRIGGHARALIRVLPQPVEQRGEDLGEGLRAADRHHVQVRRDAPVVEALAAHVRREELLEDRALRRTLLARALRHAVEVDREVLARLDAPLRTAALSGLALEVGVHPVHDLVRVLEREPEDHGRDPHRDVAAEIGDDVAGALLRDAPHGFARELPHARLEAPHGAGQEEGAEEAPHARVLGAVVGGEIRSGRRLARQQVGRRGAEARRQRRLVLEPLPDVLEAREEPAVELLQIVGRRLVAELAVERMGIVVERFAERVVVDHRRLESGARRCEGREVIRRGCPAHFC